MILGRLRNVVGAMVGVTGLGVGGFAFCEAKTRTPANNAILQCKKMQRPMIVTGTFIHSLGFGNQQVLTDHAVGVQADGTIAFVAPKEQAASLGKQHAFANPTRVELTGSQFCMPGMIDTHVHAPQYTFTGTGYSLPLLEWLMTYTFPTEAKYSDVEFATEQYNHAVSRFVKNGTTTACYFASIHVDATLALVDVVANVGQRAYIGKVNMDANSPDYYREGTSDSAADTIRFIEAVLAQKHDRVLPIVTPRFVPSCTSHLLSDLGAIAAKYDLPIQSHLCESKAEICWVKELHPEEDTYTAVYDRFNLLTNKTVMAHCVHMTDSELDLMKSRDAGIAHCPNSNFSLMSGVMKLRKTLEKGIKVGLGTDVAGGFHPSILDAARQAIIASKVVYMDDNTQKPLSHKDAMHIATVGGSEVLGLQDKIGNFIVGKQFDALIIDPCVKDSPIDVQSFDTIDDVFEKFVYLGDDRNITRIFVSGDEIVSSDDE
eukprot:m.119383 g.119383  ORF g.119383 m.119383 type:complete len:487 (-) comp28733_c0_seq1:642-2102(-)